MSTTSQSDFLVPWFIDLLIRSCPGPVFIGFHWFVHLLTHWFIDSLIYCFIGSLIRWFIGSLIRWFIDSVVQWFNVHIFIYCFFPSRAYFFIRFQLHLNHHFIIRGCTSQVQHFIVSACQKLSYRPIGLSKLPPWRVLGAIWYPPHGWYEGWS